MGPSLPHADGGLAPRAPYVELGFELGDLLSTVTEEVEEDR
jgi:hypothetical protein